jgi:hypothetical protein
MERTENVPPASGCEAWPMNQFIDANLSAPRGPVCWISETNATPWSISVQRPALRWTMSMGDASGFMLVPDACIGSAFDIPGMFMPAIPCI